MNRNLFVPATGAAAVTAIAVLLSGCGSANGLINSAIPPVDNLLNLNGQTANVSVNGTRAVISGSGTKEISFDDRSLPEVNRLKFVKFSQKLSRNITIAVPSGASMPAQFSLSNIALTLTVRDAAPRTVSAAGTVIGPITFVRVGSTSQYEATEPVTFSSIEMSGDGFGTFRDIVTTAPSPNTAIGKVAFDTNTDQLPSGSILSVTFESGQAKVGI